MNKCQSALRSPQLIHTHELHITSYLQIISSHFCKSKNSSHHCYRCAIARCRLCLSANPATWAFGSVSQFSRGCWLCLRASHVTNIMRVVCRLAYPDSAHDMRIHESRIVAHSNRVTAAYCLKAGGATDEEIAFRLWWQLGSVPPINPPRVPSDQWSLGSWLLLQLLESTLLMDQGSCSTKSMRKQWKAMCHSSICMASWLLVIHGPHLIP